MKTIYSILLILLMSSCGTTLVTFPMVSESIDVPGTKDEIYIRANQWMVRHFESAKNVIQFTDKEAGKIMGKYLMRSMIVRGKRDPVDVYSLITISVKDNATKIEIEPMGKWLYGHKGYNYKPETAQRVVRDLITDYRHYMVEKSSTW